MPVDPANPLLIYFTDLVRILCTELAVRGAGPNPMPATILRPSWGWLQRSLRRFTGLLERFQAGRLRPWPRPLRGTANPATDPAPRPAVPPGARLSFLPLPRGQGILRRLLKQPASMAAHRLTQLLALSEMQALIAADPGVGRLLRPLARLLDIELPAALQLPRRVRPPRLASSNPASPKPRAPRHSRPPPAPPPPPDPFGDIYDRHFLPGHIRRSRFSA